MAEEKTPLILIPALLCTKKLYQHQMDTLSDIADITVPEIYKYDNIPDMAQAILEKAPDQFALGGTSMGGYVALEIMRTAPDRVTRLALIGTRAGQDSEETRMLRQASIEELAEDTFLEQVNAMSRNFIAEASCTDGRLPDLITSMAKEVGREGFVREQTAIMNRIDSTPFLKDIKCKTAVICGRYDKIIDDMREMRRQIPLAKFVVIEDCGHLCPIEQPIAVSAVLRYWLG